MFWELFILRPESSILAGPENSNHQEHQGHKGNKVLVMNPIEKP